MKSVLLLIIFAVVSFKSQSPVYTLGQSPINKPQNSYIKDTNNILNKFEGTWKYSENGKVFTIVLQKVEMVFIIDYYKDLLKGEYKYINNGITIVDTSNFPLLKSKLTGAKLWEGNANKITLFFDDPERPKMSCEVTLTYSNINGIEKLHWDLKLTGYVSSRDPNMSQATDFRVPTNVELIKQ
ncbi:hypothetical protein EG349_15685 [Chryseobacterium shandongense]|uniref:DUF6705 domain-containing protein n=1 Tax=Chryseobacterium shandongense TaxID=1493872 RepID=A0A3G6MKG3_9FLAO|nr:DUF6705 family protein [Chryseobacterium shandongense]AZA56222.1 hypothetical protein EG350_02980 [Chryseobacterium shandongense]AZA88131.1 hypothetical protein EG349_15685 [Chryseobacterium shandongense]AZA96692.1 hypothetical protein EG353_14470 [Chryseobacterium shandongense]